jgi:hypothetical protein
MAGRDGIAQPWDVDVALDVYGVRAAAPAVQVTSRMPGTASDADPIRSSSPMTKAPDVSPHGTVDTHSL